jgi:hypothetical protein
MRLCATLYLHMPQGSAFRPDLQSLPPHTSQRTPNHSLCHRRVQPTRFDGLQTWLGRPKPQCQGHTHPRHVCAQVTHPPVPLPWKTGPQQSTCTTEVRPLRYKNQFGAGPYQMQCAATLYHHMPKVSLDLQSLTQIETPIMLVPYRRGTTLL